MAAILRVRGGWWETRPRRSAGARTRSSSFVPRPRTCSKTTSAGRGVPMADQRKGIRGGGGWGGIEFLLEVSVTVDKS